MEGPLSVVLKLSHPAEMTIAVAIGVGFGFALERGGFGSADRLVAIFYGRDFRVMRVMFSAIVTAMVGLYALDLLRVLPISSIGVLDTYLWPQLVGGLILGAGFIIGGYCPGTSVVAAMSGKIDALLFMGGIVLGSVVFSLGAESFMPLISAGARGRVLLHEALGVSSGVMVFAVALFAVGAFWAVGKIERAVRARRPAPVDPAEPSRDEAAVLEGSAS